MRVALTFDAEHPSRPHCPPGNELRILHALDEAGVRATFFLQGRWATAHPDVARAISGAGHLVGNHSHHHAPFTQLSAAGVADDLRQADAAIREVTGHDARPWFRFPFGEGEDHPGLASALSSAGYRNVGWHVDPNDWDPSRTASDVEEAVVRGVLARRDGTIVLLHAWPGTTAEALPHILARLGGEGARFVAVDDVLEPAD